MNDETLMLSLPLNIDSRITIEVEMAESTTKKRIIVNENAVTKTNQNI